MGKVEVKDLWFDFTTPTNVKVFLSCVFRLTDTESLKQDGGWSSMGSWSEREVGSVTFEVSV